MKPTAMLEDALSDLANGGELVLHPFLGAGSTLIAAENTSRVFGNFARLRTASSAMRCSQR
jgi:DNA modification methylase